VTNDGNAPPREEQHERRTAALDGPALARMLRAATDALHAQADAINAINVFPVPDGDTGTNMALTMQAAADAAAAEMGSAEGAAAGAVARAAARGALMGAKGNSGVILSQILAGIAAVAEGRDTVDPPALASALATARDAAYAVVSEPREGTILTAIAAAARAAADCADAPHVGQALDAVVAATEQAVRESPDLLPVLKDAGVVDSGAQGLYVAFAGALGALRGEAPAPAHETGAIDPAWLAATSRLHSDAHAPGVDGAYCTQFLITDATAGLETVRARLHELGDSVLVVGGDSMLRVHLHTADPESAIAYGRTVGAVSQERLDDLASQIGTFAEAHAPSRTQAATDVAVVAVGRGDGVERLLRSMGAIVVHGGQTMNPSAGDILAAIESAPAPDVIVLPNNGNVVLAARQAANEASRNVHLVESRSVPQGIAALVAFVADATVDENLRAMRAAAALVHTVEVTRAARDSRIGALQIRAGQAIALVDGDLLVAEDDLRDAALAGVERALRRHQATLLTLYYGEGATVESADDLARELRQRHNVDVDIVAGGQPHYPYWIGIE